MSLEAALEEGRHIASKLWQEDRLLEQFMYKNKNQQRHTLHFRKMQRAAKDLRFLHQLHDHLQNESLTPADLEAISQQMPALFSQLQEDIIRAGKELWRVIYLQQLLGFAVCSFCVLSRLLYLVQALEHLHASLQSPRYHLYVFLVLANRRHTACKEVPQDQASAREKQMLAGELSPRKNLPLQAKSAGDEKPFKLEKEASPESVRLPQPTALSRVKSAFTGPTEDKEAQGKGLLTKIPTKAIAKSKYLKDVFALIEQVNTGTVSSGAVKRKKKS